MVSVDGIFEIGRYSDVTFTGGAMPCPECGNTALVIDGEYRSDYSGAITMTLAPSPAQLLRLQTALTWGQKALHDSADPAMVEAKLRKTVEKEAPGLAAMVDSALGPKGVAAANWVLVLVAVIALFTGSQQHELTPEDIYRIIEQVQENDSGPDTPPSQDQPLPKRQQSPGKTGATESM